MPAAISATGMPAFDGASGRGELASTAHVAKLLDAPVLLVLDASAMAAGAVDYVVKSEVTPETLRRTLRYAAERARVTALLAILGPRPEH